MDKKKSFPAVADVAQLERQENKSKVLAEIRRILTIQICKDREEDFDHRAFLIYGLLTEQTEKLLIDVEDTISYLDCSRSALRRFTQNVRGRR